MTIFEGDTKMSGNKEMKELNPEEMKQVAGGNIIDDMKSDIDDVINLNPIGAIKKWANTYDARSHNKAELYKAACKNGIETPTKVHDPLDVTRI